MKEQGKTLWGDGHYLDCGDGFMYVYIPKHQIVHFKYVHFILYPLYLNEFINKV